MSSGYFPIDKWDERHKELTAIANKLGVITGDAWEAAIELDCSDNAANDGTYITYLSLAREFILRTLATEAPTKD